MPRIIHIEEPNVAVTAVLKRRVGGTWQEVKKLLSGRRVQVNGNLCLDEGRRVSAGDVVKVLDHAAARPPGEADLRIRHADEHLVIVEKPAGLTSTRHAEEQGWSNRRRNLQPTLEELLPRVLARQSGAGRAGRRGKPAGRKPGPGGRFGPAGRLPQVIAVHRLDRDTSGLMVFARTPAAAAALIALFKRHDVDRRYLAVCHGHPQPMTIDVPIIRDRGDGVRQATDHPPPGSAPQRAVTHVWPLGPVGGAYHLVECRLKTGRTHQIRIHMALAGHLICGEKLYNKPMSGPAVPDASGAPRQALHSHHLGLVHPMTGQQLNFKMDWPPDMQTWLDGLAAR